ncbi:hypothetical protein LWC34_40315 [Kibdelosporangium philippinense]|uniref:Lipoprotein n=1 Tax=Kibdelosporangium philippinense TaxID=211113 RepID=A0ABS8ZML3_9PSEU|nr:hypothetical protein [Kibdelosporangium philippinense]MCE7009016.1 hypothetical protein [Kibdelosporangium philippinense]
MKGLVVVAALLAACSPDSAALPVPSSVVKSDIDKMRDYKKCMIEHKADLPYESTEKLDVSAATLAKAEKECAKFLPDTKGGPLPVTPEEYAAKLKLAKCVRDNGVPEFPDPRPDGVDEGIKYTTDPKTVGKAFDACARITMR